MARLAEKLGFNWKEEKRFQAVVTKGKVAVDGEQEIHLLLPTTYMNLSGRALRLYLDYYRLPIRSVVVVTDDTALSFGDLRLRIKGSAGGHNGLKSVATHLGTEEYIRLRLGVGAPPKEWTGEDQLADYVLSSFNREEIDKMDLFIERGVETLLRLMHEDVQKVMNDVNVKKTIPHLGTGEKNE